MQASSEVGEGFHSRPWTDSIPTLCPIRLVLCWFFRRIHSTLVEPTPKTRRFTSFEFRSLERNFPSPCLGIQRSPDKPPALKVHAAETETANDNADTIVENTITDEPEFLDPQEERDLLLTYVTNQKRLPASDIRRIMSNRKPKSSSGMPSKGETKTQQFQAQQFQANMLYRVCNFQHAKVASLIDGGANGGLIGDDARILNKTMRKVDISGIDNHQVTGLDVVTAAGLVRADKGFIILIMHQYAHLGTGKTIHSKGQVEAYGNKVDDSARSNGGKQCMKTVDGYVIPFSVRNGLHYLDMSIPTDQDMAMFPHCRFDLRR